MLHLGLSVVVGWWAIPRVCRLCDARCARQRLISNPPTATPSITITSNSVLGDAEILERLAMTIRSGINARHALETMAAEHLLPQVFHDTFVLHAQDPFRHTLEQLQQRASNSASSRVASLLMQSYRHGSLEPSALDVAVNSIRIDQRRTAQVHAATAQSRMTFRILTVLPVASLVLAAVLSSSVRHLLRNPLMVLLITIGLFLDICGFVWMRTMSRSIDKSAQPTALQELLTSASISLGAGDSLMTAMDSWQDINPTGRHIAERLRRGEPLHIALHPLDDDCGALGEMMRRVLTESHLSGIPITEVVSRIQHDVEAEINRHTEIAIRQLSTKLTMPTVLCVLPAFLLLALMPIAITSITSLPSSTIV